MTSYSIVAPIIIARFQGSHHVFYRAWSPHRYGPAYEYDIIIEKEDLAHPMMNMEYIDFLHRVCDHLDVEGLSEETPYEGHFLEMKTEFHCMVPLSQRGDTCYGIWLGETLFSPLFFLQSDAELYLRFLSEEFITLRSQFRLFTIPHETI